MFSSAGTTSSRYSQGFGKSYAPHVPKGFTVRVFKGPALSSFPHSAPAKVGLGYHNFPLTEPRHSQNWYSSTGRPQTTSNFTSASSEPPKSSRSQTTNNSTATSNRPGAYESNPRSTAPSYSIYQSSKDTYIYEPSLSSKSDIHSNAEYDDASTAAFTPSSAFSPAMSTDSITALSGAMTPDASLTDLPPTTPTSFRNSIPSFPMHIPGLSQAHSAIRGIFRSPTPLESQSTRTDTSYAPHAPSARPTPSLDSSDVSRSTAPIRLSTTFSGSGDRTIPHNSYSTTSSAEYSSQPYARARSPFSEAEHSELDRVARANAEYNAASSASSSAYYSARDSMNFSTAPAGAANGVGEAHRQIYPNLPLRSSPEQQHAYVHGGSTASHTVETSRERPSSYHTQTDAMPGPAEDNNVRSTPPYRYAPSESEGTVTSLSEQFIPPLEEWVDNMERRQAAPRRQSEEHSPSQIPEFRNEGPTASRYVPASRTMPPNSQPAMLSTASSELSAAARAENDRPLPIPPPTTQSRAPQRERKVSLSQPPVSSTSSLFYASGEGGGAAPFPQSSREDEQRRRSSIDQQSAPYAPYIDRHSDMPHSREYPPTETSTLGPSSSNLQPLPVRALPPLGTSPEQMHRLPSTHHAGPQTQDYLPAPPSRGLTSNNVSATATRQPSTSPTRAPSLRTSPEQMQRVPSTHYAVPARSQDRAPAPSSGVLGSNYVSSSSTQQANTSPHQGRRNSIVIPTTRPSDPPISANPIPTSSPNRPQQNSRNSPPRTQQSVGFGPREPQSHVSDRFTDNTHHNNEPSVTTSYPVYPSAPVAASASQRHTATNEVTPVRARYNSDQRPFDSIPNQQPFAPPSVSSDPGPARDPPRMSFVESQRTGGSTSYSQTIPVANARTSAAPLNSASIRPEIVLNIPEDVARSQAPFPDPRRPLAKLQRRYSDSDRSFASNPYPPAHPPYPASNVGASTSAVPIEPQPQRRYSDGDQINQSNEAPERQSRSLALFRTVRWNENLVCPSPIFAHQRRKGWFNRRGDQLWTNDGAYKPPLTGQEYPSDLDCYPEHGEGWMNEENIRIDMGHRLIPKAPLKSALKRCRPQHIQLDN